MRFLLAIALASVLLAACGGSSSSSSSSSSSTSTTSSAVTSTSTGSSSITSGPVRGTLRGENHAPTVGRAWRYEVSVTDAAGRPLTGTVDVEFAFGGQVVGRDTPPTHPLSNGKWKDSLKFPAPAVGMPLQFRTVVHSPQGTITLDWPITVRQ